MTTTCLKQIIFQIFVALLVIFSLFMTVLANPEALPGYNRGGGHGHGHHGGGGGGGHHGHQGGHHWG